MADTLLYQSLGGNPDKPSSLNEEQWEAAKGQARELTPDKGKVWTLKLSKQGEEAYNGLGHTGDSNSPLTDKQKLDFLITTTREEQRATLSNKKRADAQEKYKKDLEANAAKKRLNTLTDDEINAQLANENISEKSGYTAKDIANNKLRLQMKHINNIYHNQIKGLEAQREQLAKELDTLRSQGMINNAKRAQFEELGKQIEVLNGKMYNGSGMDPDTLTGLLDQRTMLQKEYDELNKKDPYNKRLIAITNELGKINKQLEKSNLEGWVAARKKEFEEHNAAIDKEWEDIENKINAESEVKDGDIELEHAVAKAIGGYYQQVQEEGKVAPKKGTVEYHEGETARTRAQRRIIEKFQEAADKKDTRAMRKILEQHPDIAKKLGYDPVIQRKFNRLKNSEEKVRKFAEQEKTVYGTKFSDNMIKLAAEVQAKNPGMTEKQALEAVRNRMLGVNTPTGETFVSPKDEQAARKFTAKQAERNAALQAEAAKHKKQFDYMADRISNAVTAGNLTPQQGQLLLDRAKKQYETSMSTLAVKNGGGGKQQRFTPQPPTVRNQSVDGIVGNMLAVRDAETAQKFDSLSDADKAVQFIRMGYDYSQLPQRYRNALDNSDYVNDSLTVDEISREEFDDNKDGIISQDEAKKHNIRVQTTYDENKKPIQVYRNRHTDFSQLGNDSARAFFARDEFNKGDFSRLQKRIFKAIGDQYTAEQKQELAQGLVKEKLESEQANSGFKTAIAQAELAAKKVFADSSYKLSNADYKVIAATSKEKNISMEQAAKLHLENQLGKTSLPDVKDTTVNRNKFAQYGEQWLKLSGDQKLSVLSKEKDLTQKAAVLGLAKKDDESGKIIPISPSEIKKDNLVQLKQLAKEENDFLDEAGLPKDSGYWGRALRNFVGTGLEAEIAELENWLKNQTDVPKHYQPRYKSWFDALENLPERHRNFEYIGNKFREEYLPHRPQGEIDRIYKEYLKSIGRDEWDVLLPDQRNELSKRLKSDHENYFFNVYLPKYQKLLKLREELAKNGK